MICKIEIYKVFYNRFPESDSRTLGSRNSRIRTPEAQNFMKTVTVIFLYSRPYRTRTLYLADQNFYKRITLKLARNRQKYTIL